MIKGYLLFVILMLSYYYDDYIKLISTRFEFVLGNCTMIGCVGLKLFNIGS
jgi:hypothetical protein